MAGFLASLAGSILTGLATGTIREQMSMQTQDAINDENAAQSFKYGQYAQQNAAQNQVSGIRRAGLNPALASGGNFSAAATPQPMGVHSSATDPDPLSILQMLATKKVSDAQSNLMDAQATDIEISTGERLGEQYALDAAAKHFMRQEIESNSPYASAYQQILDNQNAISGGAAKALRYWNQFVNEKDNADAQAIANSFVNEVYRQKLTNGAAKILATMPQRDLQRFAMDYVKNNAEVSRLLASTNLTNAQIKESAAHTHSMLTDSDFKYHKDFAAMFKNEDYSAAAAALFQSAVQGAAAGAGLYVGTKLPLKLLQKGRAIAPTTKRAFDQLYKTGFEGKKLQKKVSPLSGLSQSEQNRRILSYY